MITLPEFTTEGRLRSHLSLIHGMYVGDVKDLAGLDAAHESSHEQPDYPYYLDHAHDSGIGSMVTPGSGTADDLAGNHHPDDCLCDACRIDPEEWTW